MNVSIDDIIEEQFNNYVNMVTESGLPLWIAQMYDMTEPIFSLNEDIEFLNSNCENYF